MLNKKTSTRVSLNNVLFATDFSAAAEQALPYALAVCRHYGSMLHAVHVIPEFNILVHTDTVNPVTFETAYEAERREALERMRHLSPDLANIPHHMYVRRGKIWDVLSEVIGKQHIDLLVIGTHGRTGIGKLVMGSVAEEFLRQASCPVLTVGPRSSGRVRERFDDTGENTRFAGIELKNIIFATDFTPESVAAAPYAISLAEEFQARLGLLHVIEESQPTPSEWALESLERLLPEEAALWCRPGTIVKFGSPAEKIVQAASESNADLIVLGVRAVKAHLAPATHFPWATVPKVIANASCPVLTIRK